MPERQIIEPIDAEEIKSGIVTKICEAIYDAMNKTCNLYGCAYPKFSAKGKIDLALDNFGEIKLDTIQFESESEGEFHNPVNLEIPIEIPETPPNVFRKETGQSIPIEVEKDDGSIERKAIFYKRERTLKIGRENADEDI